MDGRHEVKHYISVADYYALRARLGTVLKCDSHAGTDGTYLVRSLYFDTCEDRALYEKLDGVRDRDKYRLRYYDYNTEFIQLEKKSKHSDLCVKRSERITKEEVIRILDGNLGWMKDEERPLLKELYGKMQKEHLMPKTIVDYTRDPFVFSAGNVRVTLDHHIRAGMGWFDMVAALALAFCLGVFIFFIYKKTYQGVMYSAGFGVTLIALTMITTLVILAVTSNVVLSLGMVGALSIVRFRTAIKEPLDIAFLFWAIAGGIVLALGASGMAESFSEDSSQVFIDAALDFQYESGDTLLITDIQGNEIFQYEVKKSGNSVIFSSEQLKDGEKYTITVGDNFTETTAGFESSLKGASFGGLGRGDRKPDFSGQP